MKPSYYLEPDAEKMRSFFRSFSLHKDLTTDLERISINRIWIDETENGWELEYSSPVQPDSNLLDTLSEHIKTSFNLKKLAWKRLQDAIVSVSVPATDIIQADSETDEANPVFDLDIPVEEMPPDADCESVPGIEEDETYLQAYNALYGNKYADGCLFGKNFKANDIVPLNKLTEARRHVVIQGHIGTQRDKDDKLVAYTEREVRGRNKDASRLLVQFNVVDADGGIYVKVFFDDHDDGNGFKKQLKPGKYNISFYEKTRPEKKYNYSLEVSEKSPEKKAIQPTGEIMPDRDMSEAEIWKMMMQPSVVVDIDFFKHQDVYSGPDADSKSLGTLHGQTQGLKVISTEGEWALIGAWNHEDASAAACHADPEVDLLPGAARGFAAGRLPLPAVRVPPGTALSEGPGGPGAVRPHR